MRCRLLAILLLAGCTAGSGDLPVDAALVDAEWIEVDLATGEVAAIAAPDGRALTGSRWRTSHVLFHRIPVATWVADSSLLPGGGEAEDACAATSPGACHLAVFELTGAQWAALGGEGGHGTKPLSGVAADEVIDTLAATRLSRMRLDLPDAGLWTVACAAGGTGMYCWGNGLDDDASGVHAVRLPRSSTPPAGPREVGSLLANAWGFFDMHGNVWEMVRRSDGSYEARGGAWDSPTLQCRTANCVALPGSLAAPQVGVRLALRP